MSVEFLATKWTSILHPFLKSQGLLMEVGESRFQEQEVREAGVKIQCLLFVIGHCSHELTAAMVT